MDNLHQIQTIDAYFSAFGRRHVQKASQLLQPLHVPGRDPLPDFSTVARQPFEPQAHVIAAAVKMLNATRRGIIAAECGSGKSTMGALTIHQHASRSVRRGGCNCNYRAIILCPDHLIWRWRDELEETIPGDRVTLFDEAGKGCKHLITDITRLWERMRGPGGRCCKPQGAE
jgi:superfamily II DNA or RNA helicase